MPEPIEFLIIQNLQAALQGITVAGGYHYDVQATLVKLDPNQNVEALVADKPRPFVVIDVVPERWQYLASGQVRVVMPLVVYWVGDSHPDADEMPDQDESRLRTYLRGCADVEKAIAPDYRRGGYATDTKIVKQTFNGELDGRDVWAAIELEVLVHRVYGSPNAA